MPSLAVAAASAVTLLLLLAASASAANFTCTGTQTTCQSAIGYAVPNATTYAELLARFNTTTLADLLGANSLPATTPATTAIPSKATVNIPFRCRCHGGVGQSDGHPIYIVKPQDGLDAIARNSFGAFVTYQEIATANKITNPNLIQINQSLWIPLPCSCDPVDGANVVHFAYSVAGGDSTAGIAAKYGVLEQTLLRINGINDPKNLDKGQILDVPLPVCHSSISNTSADHNLLVPNGTYALTAQGCVKCSCSGASSGNPLECTVVQGNRCPAAQRCNGTLMLGQTTGTGCGSTTCSYSGYSGSSSSLSIHTTLANNQTGECQSQKGGSARTEIAGLMWRMSVISFHMVLIFVCFF